MVTFSASLHVLSAEKAAIHSIRRWGPQLNSTDRLWKEVLYDIYLLFSRIFARPLHSPVWIGGYDRTGDVTRVPTPSLTALIYLQCTTGAAH